MREDGLLNTMNGIPVILSESLTQAGEPQQVRYSWRQRLLSWPWRPWVATYTVIPQVPYRGAMQMASGRLLMHPATFRALKEATDLAGSVTP